MELKRKQFSFVTFIIIIIIIIIILSSIKQSIGVLNFMIS